MIKQTHNMARVNAVLSHPDIWRDVAPEGCAVFDIPYDPSCTYFMVNGYEGVIIFHPFRDGVKIHPNILPEYRGKAAYRSIEAACQAIFEQSRNIYAEIDVELRHVTLCARHLGFRLLERGDRDIYIRRKLDS